MRGPVDTLRVEYVPSRLHLGVRRVDRDAPVTRRLVRWHDVDIRLVDVDPDEVEWRGDGLQLVVGEPRRILPGPFQVVVGVPALEHHGGEVGIQLASRSLGSLHVLGALHDWNSREHVLCKAHLRTLPAAGADRLHGEAVAEHGVMTHLIELAVRQLQSWSTAKVYFLAAADLHIDPLVPTFDE